MAENVSVGGKINEEGYTRPWYSWFTEGAAMSLAETAWKAIQRAAGANMSVDIQQGNGAIDISSSYMYWGWIATSDKNVSVDAADPSNPRIDRVVAYIDLSAVSTSLTNNTGALKFKAVAGTPAGSPSAPSDGVVQASVGSGNPWIDIAQLSVTAGDTSIVTADITDKRKSVAMRAPLAPAINTLTATTNLSYGYDRVLINAASGSVQAVLPDPTLQTGRVITVQRIDSTIANTARITRFGSTNISGVNDIYLPNQWDSVELYSDGTNWKIASHSIRRELIKVNVTSAQTGITTADLTGLTTVGSANAGIVPTSTARLKVIYFCPAVSDSNGTTFSRADVKDVTNANTIINSGYGGVLNSSTSNQHYRVEETYAPGTAGARSWKVTVDRTAGSGTISVNPQATSPMFVQVELEALIA